MKRKYTVIADDITGAAEIAGIGYSFGLQTVLMTETEDTVPECELLVFATDTRSMNRHEAVEETRRVIRYLKSGEMGRLFKKTDSALRGHISAELQALMEETDYKQVLLLPQNPTKGRIVRNGIYYIDETPLHETAFAYDPEFPAHSSAVGELVQDISVIDATDFLQVEETIKSIHESYLLAGGADLFTACMLVSGYVRQENNFDGLTTSKTLIVCGSTQSSSLDTTNYIRNYAIPTLPLSPSAFYEGVWDEEWIGKTVDSYTNGKGMVLTTSGYAAQEGKDFAVRLRHTMARIVEKLTQEATPGELVIEGGATAFAILSQLGWKSFCLTDEISPGVVRMKCMTLTDTYVTLKPGSYSWGKLFA